MSVKAVEWFLEFFLNLKSIHKMSAQGPPKSQGQSQRVDTLQKMKEYAG